MNALKHGMRSKEVLDITKAANAELRSFKESLKELDISTKDFALYEKAVALDKLMSLISD